MGSVGGDKKQFIKMIDTARLNPDVSAMIPGRMKKSEAGSWQHELQQVIFKLQVSRVDPSPSYHTRTNMCHASPAHSTTPPLPTPLPSPLPTSPDGCFKALTACMAHPSRV